MKVKSLIDGLISYGPQRVVVGQVLDVPDEVASALIADKAVEEVKDGEPILYSSRSVRSDAGQRVRNKSGRAHGRTSSKSIKAD